MENEYVFDVELGEIDDENENDLKVDTSRISQAVIWGTDWTTETLASQLKKGNIDLRPSFQRRDAWSDKDKSRLIESLILGFPVPPIILAESKNKKNPYIVIDGKQRLLSIIRFYSDVYENLDDDNYFRPLKLKGLDILNELNGMSYADIQNNYREFADCLDNQTIRTIVIKNWFDESFLYAVFHRLNTGSKPLSPQELRQSLMPGEFLSYLNDLTANSNVFKTMLKNQTTAASRMKDMELALRFYAYKYFIDQYNGNLKDFLDLTCINLNTQWETKKADIKNDFIELEESIKFSQNIFDSNSPFSRYVKTISSKRFNRSVFEIFTYYFSIKNIREAIHQKEILKSEFIKLNDDSEFIDSVEATTKDVNKVYTRFIKFFNLLINLEDIKGKNISIPKIILDNGKFTIEVITS